MSSCRYVYVWVCVEVRDQSWVFFFLSHSPYCLRQGLSPGLGFQWLGCCLANESREPFCPHLLALELQVLATMPGFICGCWGSCSCHTHIMWSLESLDRGLLYYLSFSTWGETLLPKATCFSASFRLWPSAFPLFYLPKTNKQANNQQATQN